MKGEVHLVTWRMLVDLVGHSMFSQESHLYQLKRELHRCNSSGIHRNQFTEVVLVKWKAELHLVIAEEVVLSLNNCYTLSSCCNCSSANTKKFLK